MVRSMRQYARYGALLLIFIVASLGGVYLLKVSFGAEYPLMVVVSQSMIPTLDVGDFIIVGRIDDLKSVTAAPRPNGDILVFQRSGSSEDYIVHRSIQKYQQNGVWWFVTKGDNNAVQDGQPVPEGNVMGKVLGRIPILGYFPLFIKTLRGFLLVVSLMAVVFFADYLMPVKQGARDRVAGKFPWLSLIPLLVPLLAIVSFWFVPIQHANIEVVALISWYVGCLMVPISFADDDVCFMVWLYHLVLVMIPVCSDLVWWMTGITPSTWWYGQGSSIPLTWLLLNEGPMFNIAYTMMLWMLVPGCALFLLMMLAKRRGIDIVFSASHRVRSVGSHAENG